MYWLILKPLFLLLALMIMVIFIRLLFISFKYNNSQYGSVSGNRFLKTAFDKGLYGEFLTFWNLEKLDGNNHLLTNIYIPKEDGTTTEIDLIMINPTGIYVFESKNYSGWIYGDEKNKNWTQTLNGGREKNKFFNPVWQNKAHISALNKFLNEVNSKSFYSYIVFSDRCELKKVNLTSSSVTIMKRQNLLVRLKRDLNERSAVLSDQQITRIYERLKNRALADGTVKEQHIKNIKCRL